VTISDNDSGALPTVVVEATDGLASEGCDTGAFTIWRHGDVGTALTIAYALSGTANNGVDFTALPGSVALSGGSTAVVVNVTPLRDKLKEGNETVVLTLLDGSNYTVTNPANATVTITDFASPVGSWVLAIKGSDKGIGYITFGDDFSVNAYGIRQNSFGLFTDTGTWSFDATGQIIGGYTEQLNGTDHAASFTAKAICGRKLSMQVVADNGTFAFKGVPASSFLNLAGHWRGEFTRLKETFPCVFDLAQTNEFPALFLLIGEIPEGTNATGAVIIDLKGKVNAFTETETVTNSYSGKFSATTEALSLKGADRAGEKASIRATRQQ
jgi:hypothetical protein